MCTEKCFSLSQLPGLVVLQGADLGVGHFKFSFFELQKKVWKISALLVVNKSQQ